LNATAVLPAPTLSSQGIQKLVYEIIDVRGNQIDLEAEPKPAPEAPAEAAPPIDEAGVSPPPLERNLWGNRVELDDAGNVIRLAPTPPRR
jgi:hypothetical protein